MTVSNNFILFDRKYNYCLTSTYFVGSEPIGSNSVFKNYSEEHFKDTNIDNLI